METYEATNVTSHAIIIITSITTTHLVDTTSLLVHDSPVRARASP